ncbi:MAG: NAD(P)/FAD-dependent oxidoreductase [Clostridia bacterium]
MNKICVIGAGAAGIISAIEAAKSNNEVYLIEKNDQLGKKLRITGKGRCNITFQGDQKQFMDNLLVNSKFMYSAFKSFSNLDVVDFFNSIGVDTKIERGNRVFPVSDSATMVVEALGKKLKSSNVKIIYSADVKDIILDNCKVSAVKYEKNGKEFILNATKVILATGGNTYKVTGSTGDGYKLAMKVGHSLVKVRPALVPLKTNKIDELEQMQGLSLKNVSLSIKASEKEIYKDFGEMMFAHFGLTGPLVLSASSKLSRVKNIEEQLRSKNIRAFIDLKPALSEEQLNLRIQRDFEKYSNKEFRNSLDDLLPKKLIQIIIKRSKISETKKVHQITKEERLNLINCIKNLEYTIEDFMPVDLGIVTAGGINVKEVDPKTMESKIVKGLFFAGEILDIDGYTGGYNLQIAFSTGFVAGRDN